MLLKPRTDLAPNEQALVKSLTENCLPLEKAAALAQEFWEMVREQESEALEDWIERVSAAEGAVELHRFAEGLKDDLPAVKAALSPPRAMARRKGK
jgi:transposase